MSSQAQTQKRTFSENFVRFFDRWTPNSMVFAYLLTIIVAVLALIFTKAPLVISGGGKTSLVDAWVQGFWNLLLFSMQMALIMITGSIVATAPPVRKLLQKVAAMPNNLFQVFLLVGAVNAILFWLHWGVGMMVSIQLGRQVIISAKVKGFKLHTPAFVGLLYSFAIAGIGISQAGPIYGATPNGLRSLVPDAVKASIPELIPLTESVLLPTNLIACIIVTIVVFIVCWTIRPKKESDIVEPTAELIAEIEAQNKIGAEKVKASSPAEWIDNSITLSLIVGLAGLIWIIKFVATVGLGNISINNFNFILLILGILLCGSPNQFIKGVQNAVNSTWGVIIQFPFYAGIFGIIVYTGLSTVIVNFFMSFATKENFPFLCFVYSSILNMAVPSGGSKFVIEAPYILDVASRLKVPIGVILNSYTAGDQVTNIIQPFWALPYLAMFKIDFKKILPFTMFACIAGYIIHGLFFIFGY